MGKAVLAGAAYFALVFSIGFVLGAVRVFVVVPVIGETAAVFIELPVILLACWFVSGALTRRIIPQGDEAAALVMGGVAFPLLMVAELTLGTLAFERSLMDQVAHWLTLAGAAGLIGQIVFALLPWLQVRRLSV
jgi:hypothetical protein